MHASKGIRRAHRKTKTGCKSKQRRIKCDEQTPVCNNCTRREVECIWETVPREISAGISTSGQVAEVPESAVIPTGPTSMFDRSSLELMMIYMSSTSKTLFSGHSQMVDLSEQAPKLALRHDFLMHAIFALTALHIHTGSQDGSTNYYLLSDSHYQMSALGLLSLPVEKDPEVESAAFMANSLLGNYVFSCPSFASDPTSVRNIFEWFPSARTYLIETRSYWTKIFSGESTSLLPVTPRIQTKPPPNQLYPPGFPEILLNIHLPLSGAPDADEVNDPHTSCIYHQAVTALQDAWVVSQNPNYHQVSIFMWPTVLSDEFYAFMLQKRARALIILAHYCALVQRFRHLWTVRDRAAGDIQSIVAIIDQRWIPWLGMPLQIINAGAGVSSLPYGFELGGHP